MLKIHNINKPLTIWVLSALLTSTIANANTLERQVISAGGSHIAAGVNTLAYTIGQPFVTTEPKAPLLIGFWGGQATAISPPSDDRADLAFLELKEFYNVGESLTLRLKASMSAVLSNRLDLWIALQMPDGTFLFMISSPTQSFSPTPQAFQASLDSVDMTYLLLGFTVPPGFGGNYTFYAAFIEPGKNPMTDGLGVLRSELAVAGTTLSND